MSVSFSLRRGGGGGLGTRARSNPTVSQQALAKRVLVLQYHDQYVCDE